MGQYGVESWVVQVVQPLAMLAMRTGRGQSPLDVARELAADPKGAAFLASREGRAALGLADHEYVAVEAYAHATLKEKGSATQKRALSARAVRPSVGRAALQASEIARYALRRAGVEVV